MKIRTVVTVDIDPASWTANYGVEGAGDIRADVQEYVTQAAIAQLEAVGVLA